MKGEEPTLKQRQWLKIYLEIGNATEAAMQVYDCKDRHSARQIGWENLAKLDYSDFMEEAGITDKLLQQKILEGLNATRVISAKITSKEADSQTDDFIDVEDYLTRHKYLETALKLKKRLTDRVDVTSGGKPVPILSTLDVSSNDSPQENTEPK